MWDGLQVLFDPSIVVIEYIVFLVCVSSLNTIGLFVVLVLRGARRISLLGETARAVCGNYKSPELGLNLSGS
jgi:hypothetical protein